MAGTGRRCAPVLIALLCSGAVLVQPARAANVELVLSDEAAGPVARLVYTSADGELNRLSVCLSPPGDTFGCVVSDLLEPPVAYLVSKDSTGVQPLAGPGCELAANPPDESRTGSIHCGIPAGARISGPLIQLGDKDDISSLSTPVLGRGAVVRGEAGNDQLSGGGLQYGGDGNDYLSGDGTLAGGNGNDHLSAHDSHRGVHLKGGAAIDEIAGGPFADLIEPGPGRDEVAAGKGADRIRARDHLRDIIRCGPGVDRLSLDWFDLPVGRSCERIRRDGPARAIPLSLDVIPGDYGLEGEIACPSDSRGTCRTRMVLSLRNGRTIGRGRLHIRAGTTRRFENTTVSPEHRLSITLTVWTLRSHRRAIKAATSYEVFPWFGDG